MDNAIYAMMNKEDAIVTDVLITGISAMTSVVGAYTYYIALLDARKERDQGKAAKEVRDEP